MRVDSVPFWLKPAFTLWAESSGLTFYVKLISLRKSMRIELHGHLPGPEESAIFAIWHENLLPFFLVLHRIEQEQIWMNHPLWYMKPIHVLLRHLGIKELALGSTGYDGQAAADYLADRLLKTGASSMMAVDGPAGPPYQLRKGCLHLALKTGLPIIPIRFKVSELHRLEFTWDRKVWPKYRSSLTADFGAPISVKSLDEIDACADRLYQELSRS